MTATNPVSPPDPTPLVGATMSDDATADADSAPHFTQLRRVEPTALSDKDPINPVPYEALAGVAVLLVVGLVLRRRHRRRRS